MSYIFGDSFDLYTALTDATAGYWDSGSIASASIVAGRFGGQCIHMSSGVTYLVKSSTVTTDPVHHIVVAFRQTAVLSGTTLGLYFQLSDGATNQVCIVFRSDGAILLTSATPAGTVLATYTGAVTLQNQWFAFEFEVVIHPSAGSFTVRRNGNTSNDFQATALNTRPGANTQANKLSVAMNATLTAHEIDDLLWRSDASSVPWVGDIRTYVRMPASDVQAQFSRPSTPLAQSLSASLTNGGGPLANTIWWYGFQAGYSGNVTSLGANFGAGITGHCNMALYDATGTPVAGSNNGVPAGTPGPVNLIATATPLTNPTAGQVTFTMPSPPAVVKGNYYWLAMIGDVTLGSTVTGAAATPTALSLAYTYSGGAFPATSGAYAQTAGHNGFQNFTINVTPNSNNSQVNEAQQDGATTYVYDSNVGDADFYGIAPIAVTPASVVAVTTRGFLQKSDAGSRSGGVQLRSGGGPPGGDPNYANTVLLCHCDGGNGSTTFTDNSSKARTITSVSGAAQSTTQVKFGTSALGSLASNQQAATAASSDFDFQSAQFTIEAWVYASSAPSVAAIVAQFTNTSGGGWFFGVAGGGLSFWYCDTGGTVHSIIGSSTVATGAWHFVAVDRDASGVIRLYLDGAVVGSATVATFQSAVVQTCFGNSNRFGDQWPGYVDEVRVTNGVARYAGVGSVPSAAFPNFAASGSGTTVQNVGVLSTTWAWNWRTDITDPNTSAAWTPTGVNNVLIGPIVSA